MTDNYVTLDDLAEVLMLTSTDPKADERGSEYWKNRAETYIDQRGHKAAADLIRRFDERVAARNHADALDAQGEPDY